MLHFIVKWALCQFKDFQESNQKVCVFDFPLSLDFTRPHPQSILFTLPPTPRHIQITLCCQQLFDLSFTLHHKPARTHTHTWELQYHRILKHMVNSRIVSLSKLMCIKANLNFHQSKIIETRESEREFEVRTFYLLCHSELSEKFSLLCVFYFVLSIQK